MPPGAHGCARSSPNWNPRVPEPIVSHPSIHVHVFGKTDLGKTRDHNEDTFIVADLTRDRASLLPEVRDHDVGERGTLLMVAGSTPSTAQFSLS